MIFILIISLLIYLLMIFSVEHRTAFATIGLGIILLYGTLTNTYSSTEVFSSFPFEIITLILVLGLFSKVFENNSFFKYIADKFFELSKGRKLFVTITIPLIMYVTSLFMNNLSVVLLFTFICLELSTKLKLPVMPILVSGLIASNIGGCPLPWADTPAVVLTLYSGFTLIDFLTKLFIPCALYTLLLIIYTINWIKKYEKKSRTTPLLRNNEIRDLILSSNNKNKMRYMTPHHDINEDEPTPPPIPPFLHERHINVSIIRKVYCPILLFITFIFFICIAPFYNISISYISIIYIGLLLIVAIEKADVILNTVSVLDSLVFISSLFMISSTLEHYGILNIAVNYILSFTGDSKILILISILLSAFIISTFLSAGPAAATILPICLQLNPLVGNNLVFAALALGILSGSSMLPWSATGGPILLNETGRYLHSHQDLPIETSLEITNLYNLKKYTSFSVPFSLIILACSSLFLVLYLSIF